jgi:hypothetical protein
LADPIDFTTRTSRAAPAWRAALAHRLFQTAERRQSRGDLAGAAAFFDHASRLYRQLSEERSVDHMDLNLSLTAGWSAEQCWQAVEARASDAP